MCKRDLAKSRGVNYVEAMHACCKITSIKSCMIIIRCVLFVNLV